MKEAEEKKLKWERYNEISFVTDRPLAIRPYLYHINVAEQEKDPKRTKEPDQPLNLFATPFSRWDIAIKVQSPVTQRYETVKVSVDPFTFWDVLRQSHLLEQMDIKERMNAKAGNKDSSNHPAYSYRFRMGNLKDKSPAEVLLEQGNAGLEALQNQRNFLEKNAAKYKSNRDGMAAIDDAFNLYNAGLLSNEEASANTTQVYTLLKEEKCMGQYKVRNDGRCLYKTVKITWTLGADAPVHVELYNVYTGFSVDPKTKLPIPNGNKDRNSELRGNLNLSVHDWMKLVARCEYRLELFLEENKNDLRKSLAYAEKMEQEEAKKANAEKENTVPYRQPVPNTTMPQAQPQQAPAYPQNGYGQNGYGNGYNPAVPFSNGQQAVYQKPYQQADPVYQNVPSPTSYPPQQQVPQTPVRQKQYTQQHTEPEVYPGTIPSNGFGGSVKPPF